EQAAKISTPGILQVRRFAHRDVIWDELLASEPAGERFEDLLVPIYRTGRRVYDPPELADVRRRCAEQLARFGNGIKRLTSPEDHPVELEPRLADLKARLIAIAEAAA